MTCFLPRSEGKTPQNPLMPSLYLDGMAACFGSLSRRFSAGGSNAVNAGENGNADDELGTQFSRKIFLLENGMTYQS